MLTYILDPSKKKAIKKEVPKKITEKSKGSMISKCKCSSHVQSTKASIGRGGVEEEQKQEEVRKSFTQRMPPLPRKYNFHAL